MIAIRRFAALTLSLAAALPAVAADDGVQHWVNVTLANEQEQVSQLLDSDVVAAGFSFELKGQSYGYFLTLQVDNEFADQTGLVGYQIGRKIDPESTWYKLQRVFDDPQTYKSAPLALNPGQYWIRMEPLRYSTSGAQPLVFNQQAEIATPTPQVPEPVSSAMMAVGLFVVGSTARRRRGR